MSNPRYVPLILAVVFGVLFSYKIFSLSINKHFKATISKQSGNITKLDDKRHISVSRIYYLNTIDFPEDSRFEHTKLGNLDFYEHFFADFEANIEVKKTGKYEFLVHSDDGFRLLLNDQEICSHVGDRPYNVTKGNVHLSEGSYTLKINYFQGYGPMGVQVYYRPTFVRTDKILLGIDSEYIEFIEYD